MGPLFANFFTTISMAAILNGPEPGARLGRGNFARDDCGNGDAIAVDIKAIEPREIRTGTRALLYTRPTAEAFGASSR
jgi:hypothetical protein